MIFCIAMGNQRLRTGRIVFSSSVANDRPSQLGISVELAEFSRFYTESTIVSYMVSDSVRSVSRWI